jgi:hypothetical protein
MFHLFVAQVLYRHEEGEAGIEVSWSSQSMPLQAVPSSSFFRPLPLSKASYPLTMVPAMTQPPPPRLGRALALPPQASRPISRYSIRKGGASIRDKTIKRGPSSHQPVRAEVCILRWKREMSSAT